MGKPMVIKNWQDLADLKETDILNELGFNVVVIPE